MPGCGIFEFKFNDLELAGKLYPAKARARAHYDAEKGIDASCILNDAQKSQTLVQKMEEVFGASHPFATPVFERQRRFIYEMYGFLGKTPKIPREVGKIEGVGAERAKSIAKGGIYKLRKSLRSAELRKFLEECSILTPLNCIKNQEEL